MAKKADLIRRAVRTSLLTSGAIAAGVAARSEPARAADTPAEEPALQEVVVTGSRIAAPNLEAISPVTAVNAEEIKSTGATKIEDLLNSLPQVVADQGSGLSMGSTGVATVNLRGLGAQRTLVLINGRRLMGGDPNAGAPSTTNLGYGSAADVNQIPVALIERVDVLTGGASSTYGADAVAGVVNFIMNDHFEGVRFDFNAGIYNHDNHTQWINPLLQKRHFPTVSGTNWDGGNKDFTLIMGQNFADGAGNFEGYLGYRRLSPITADHRDHAACVVDNGLDLSSGTSFAPYVCGGSSNSAPAVIFNSALTAAYQICDPNYNCTTGTNGDVVKRYQRFNYAASHYLQRIDERYTAGFFGHLKLNDHVEAYTEFMFMDDDTRGNYAPAGAFLASGFATDTTGTRDGNWYVNCGTGGYGNPGMNPYLTAQAYGLLCNTASGIPSLIGVGGQPGDAQLTLARRNVEGGPREDEYSHTTWRGVFGARGEIVPNWNYDASFTYGKTRSTDWHNNDTSSSRMQDALLAITDPVTGQIVCRSRKSTCVPWNIFNPAIGVSKAAEGYIASPGLVQGASEEDIFTAFVNGDLTNAGVKLPTADEGLKSVFGVEYRRETILFRPDEEFLTADLSGIGSPTVGYDAQFHVWEGFTEFRMPLARNQPFLKSLDVEAGYRYSSYTSGFTTNTYKFGIEWAPVSDVRVRASYNRAVRAPNAAELFKPPYVALDAGTDLCAVGTYNATQCALTGLNPALFPPTPSPAGQYNGQIGGNVNLKPEVGKTTNVGFVFTPSFVPGFTATIDYTDIKISNVITSYGPNLIQTNCVLSGDPTSIFCQWVHRNAAGSLWSSPQGYTIDPLLNLSQLENRSIDLGMAYRYDLGNWGRLRSRLDGTYLLRLLTTPGGGKPFECAGLYGPSCTPVTPKWRHRLTVDWDTPVSGLSAGATWRFIGQASNSLLNPKSPDYASVATIAANGPPPDANIPTISYLDLRVSYTWNKITARAGVNNVLDKDPPIIDTINTGGNSIYAESNTFPSLYDTAGRFLFLNVTVDF